MKVTLPKAKGIIFDLDGTLLDSLADLAASGNYGLAKFGFSPVPAEGFRYYVGSGMRNMVRRALEVSLQNPSRKIETPANITNDASIPDIAVNGAKISNCAVPGSDVCDAKVRDSKVYDAKMRATEVCYAEVPDAKVRATEVRYAGVPDAKVPDAKVRATEVCRAEACATHAGKAEVVEQLIDAIVLVVSEHYSQNWHNATHPYLGIEELLASLQAKGIPFSICSNKNDAFVKKMVRRYFPSVPFVGAIGEGSTVPLKPNSTGPLLLAGQMNLRPQDIIFVGDTKVDMLTAVGAGMFPVGVSWGFRPKAELLENGAKLIVDAPEEILNCFE